MPIGSPTLFLQLLDLKALGRGHSEELLHNSCPMGWCDFNGRYYEYSYCVSEGANLASVHSDFDPAERPIWIGLSDIHMEGRWMWSDGSKVDFTKWHEKQPNGGVTENCVTTHYSGPKWFDRDCNSNLYSFVCAERLCN
uniref:C-type lectin domain-containing protein n=1 Tax=Hucho hucho TaxID=62062 RepID=A0A4W5PZ44_9TELE